MLTIKLFCQNGASTAMLADAIKKASIEMGIETNVDAFPVSTISKNIIGADIVLLAPQIKFKKASIENNYPNYRFYLIETIDYGMMNGKKVLQSALKLLEK